MSLVFRIFPVVLALQVFTGCAKPHSLDLYHRFTGNVKELLVTHLQHFSEKHPEIRVNLLYKSWAELEEIMRHSEARAGEDFQGVYMIIHDRIGQLVGNDYIRPVDTVLGTHGERVLPYAREAIAYQGKAYGLPLAGECAGLFCNTNLVSPPRTDADLLALRKDFLAPGREKYLLLIPQSIPYYVLPWVIAGGGRIFDGQGKPRIDGPETAEAFRKIRRLFMEELRMPFMEEPQILEAFTAGRVPFMVGGPWYLSDLLQNKVPLAVAEMPSLGGQPLGTFIGVQCMVVSRRMPDDAMAAVGELYDSLIRTGFPRDFAMETRSSSVFVDDRDDRRIADDPLVSAFSRQAAQGIAMNNTPHMALIWDAFNSTMLKRLLSGNEDPAPLLAALQKEIDRKLGGGK
jgi:maltose-binding protein MalE